MFGTQRDHLSGFVPVNFEPATSDDKFPHFGSNVAKNTASKTKDFSVVVTGFEGKPDADRLAQFLKDGKVEKTEAFISNSGESVPAGFQKVNLPFMDEKTAEAEELPSVFIAPVGFQVPEGYKGHRLPFDPKIVDARKPTKKPVQLVEEGPATGSGGVRDASALIRDKLKAAKNRPSLSSFYRSKARKENDDVTKDAIKDAVKKTTKKRRVLKKIVRRPFKNTVRKTFRATPASKVIINPSNPFLTEKPRVILDLSPSADQTTQTTPAPATVTETAYSPSVETTTTTVASTTEESTTTTTPTTTATSTTSTSSSTEEQETTYRSLFEDANALPEDTTVPLADVEATSGYEPTVRVAFPADHFEPTTQDEQPSLLLVTTTTEEPITPSTVGTTETTTTTTSTTEATALPEQTSAPYAPTPFLRPRPVRRLDSYNRLRSQKKVFGPTLPPPVIASSTVTPPPPAPTRAVRPKYNRYNSNKLNSGSESSSTRVYGQRLRTRKRPSTWNRYQEEIDARPTIATTTTTEKPSPKTEEYKKKFRPFFHQLNSKLANGRVP